jgi:hypothetical protein
VQVFDLDDFHRDLLMPSPPISLPAPVRDTAGTVADSVPTIGRAGSCASRAARLNPAP